MDFLDILRQMVGGAPPSGVGATSGPAVLRSQLNQPDLDPVDPATGKLMPGGLPGTQVVPPATQPAQQGIGARPLNAQDALQQGDPKLIQFLRARQGGVNGTGVAPPAPPEAAGYGAVKPRQTSFGDGTGAY